MAEDITEKIPGDVFKLIRRMARTAASRKDLLHCYPPYQTCPSHRRFQAWIRQQIVTDIQSASSHDVTLIEGSIESLLVSKPPERQFGKNTSDGEPLDNRLFGLYGAELIAPHKANQKNKNLNRLARRYRCRWKEDRLAVSSTGYVAFEMRTKAIMIDEPVADGVESYRTCFKGR